MDGGADPGESEPAPSALLSQIGPGHSSGMPDTVRRCNQGGSVPSGFCRVNLGLVFTTRSLQTTNETKPDLKRFTGSLHNTLPTAQADKVGKPSLGSTGNPCSTAPGLQKTMFVISTIVASSVVLLYLAYQGALPKPLPGIPYNTEAVHSLLGDAATINAIQKQGGRPRAWFGEQNAKHKSPLVQVFVAPLSKPMLLLSDFREGQDILLRRGKEFDHGPRNLAAFSGVLANHHIGMRTLDPRFRANRELIKDLMTPNFLHTVCGARREELGKLGTDRPLGIRS